MISVGVKIGPTQGDAGQSRIDMKRDFLLTAGLAVRQSRILLGVAKQKLNLPLVKHL